MLWPVPTVLATDASQSLPTPNTNELLRVVVRVAAGASTPFPLPVAPIAPEPLLPDKSTPVKLTRVMEDTSTATDKFAVTVVLLNGTGARARQISDVPNCALVRCTST